METKTIRRLSEKEFNTKKELLEKIIKEQSKAYKPNDQFFLWLTICCVNSGLTVSHRDEVEECFTASQIKELFDLVDKYGAISKGEIKVMEIVQKYDVKDNTKGRING